MFRRQLCHRDHFPSVTLNADYEQVNGRFLHCDLLLAEPTCTPTYTHVGTHARTTRRLSGTFARPKERIELGVANERNESDQEDNEYDEMSIMNDYDADDNNPTKLKWMIIMTSEARPVDGHPTKISGCIEPSSTARSNWLLEMAAVAMKAAIQ